MIDVKNLYKDTQYKDGIYLNMSDEEYFLINRLNQTALKNWALSTKRGAGHEWLNVDGQDTPAKSTGRIFHDVFFNGLGGYVSDEAFFIENPGASTEYKSPRQSKLYKTWAENKHAEGKQIQPADVYENLKSSAEMFRKFFDEDGAYSGELNHEIVILFTSRGQQCKAKIDAIGPSFWFDLKTSSRVSKELKEIETCFKRDVRFYKYYFQVVFYSYALQSVCRDLGFNEIPNNLRGFFGRASNIDNAFIYYQDTANPVNSLFAEMTPAKCDYLYRLGKQEIDKGINNITLVKNNPELIEDGPKIIKLEDTDFYFLESKVGELDDYENLGGENY